MFISTYGIPATLRMKGYFPQSEKLEFYTSPYSGEVKIEINGIEKTIDLFENKNSLKVVEVGSFLGLTSATYGSLIRECVLAFGKAFLSLTFFLILIYPIYQRIPSPQKAHLTAASDVSESSKFRTAQAVIVLSAILTFATFCAAFYPGVMTEDSYTQYWDAVNLNFSDWHPPIMAALWSQTNRVIEGPGGIYLLHLLMVVSSLCLLSAAALLEGKRMYFIPMLAIFLPIVSSMLFVIFKDVSLAASLLLAFSLWYFWRISGKLNKPRIILILTILFYASSVRYNALAATIPVIWLLLLDFTTVRKAVIIAVLIGAFFVFANELIIPRILPIKQVHMSQDFMSYDLMGIYLLTGKNFFPAEYLTKTQLDNIANQYKHRENLGIVFFKNDTKSISELRRAWRTALLQEPLAYMRYRAHVLKTDLKAEVWYVQPFSEHTTLHFPKHQPEPLWKETSLGRIHTSFVRWTGSYAIFLFKTLTYLVAGLGIFLFSMRRKIVIAAGLTASSLLYIPTFFVHGITGNYRYIYWPVMATLLSVFVIWIESARQKRFGI